MKKLINYILGSLFIFNISNAEVKLGVEGGLVFADMRAEETAQTIANLSGSTVNYTYDEATWAGRIFADYAFTNEVHAEVGYFLTGSLDATYKIGSDSATESYDAMGIDAAIAFHQENVFVKAGMHSSELNGNASITIGSTTYAVSDSISGSGYLVGAGVMLDDTRYGITYYSDMGGDADSDMTFLYGGVVF